ncbi:hypothetical protein AAFF_G00389590 [Aldrovandia affinis]|uniref:Uncharacterized protein n=1 Tax=Aldrovandia affinis TaxID=143900 RepID=A0AAD7SEV8_9TELE|nr:hypothetical protein AAFF_G00389590 [Aldrovandia affinis]
MGQHGPGRGDAIRQLDQRAGRRSELSLALPYIGCHPCFGGKTPLLSLRTPVPPSWGLSLSDNKALSGGRIAGSEIAFHVEPGLPASWEASLWLGSRERRRALSLRSPRLGHCSAAGVHFAIAPRLPDQTTPRTPQQKGYRSSLETGLELSQQTKDL